MQAPDERTPEDPYTGKRAAEAPKEFVPGGRCEVKAATPGESPGDRERRLNAEAAREKRGRLRKYLENDGKVLR